MKENFAIITDAGGDFTREIIAKYGIEETPMSTVVWPDGSNKPTDLYWDTMKPNEYFTLMTNKKNNLGSCDCTISVCFVKYRYIISAYCFITRTSMEYLLVISHFLLFIF